MVDKITVTKIKNGFILTRDWYGEHFNRSTVYCKDFDDVINTLKVHLEIEPKKHET